MIDTKLYTCTYCHTEYVPKRRHVQKYCTNSCRSNAHHFRKKGLAAVESGIVLAPEKKKKNKKKDKPETMSLAGVGNAAIGTFAVDSLKTVFTKVEDMPATKGDIQILVTKSEISSLASKADIQFLASKMERYQRIMNLPANLDGKLPYFDRENKTVVYF